MNRRRFAASVGAAVAALTLPRAVPAIVAPVESHEETAAAALPLRMWVVLAAVPSLGLVAGDWVSEWVRDHSLHCRREHAPKGSRRVRFPADAWPRFLEAFAAGSVTLHEFTLPRSWPAGELRRLVALHGPAEAADLAHAAEHREILVSIARRAEEEE